jgi:hypothetical protein
LAGVALRYSSIGSYSEILKCCCLGLKGENDSWWTYLCWKTALNCYSELRSESIYISDHNIRNFIRTLVRYSYQINGSLRYLLNGPHTVCHYFNS